MAIAVAMSCACMPFGCGARSQIEGESGEANTTSTETTSSETNTTTTTPGQGGSGTTTTGQSGSGGAGGIPGEPCGNGVLQPDLGEECDDGANNGGPCSLTCKAQLVLAVSAAPGHTCALLSGGVVKCWGSNDYGLLGLGDTAARGDAPGEMGGNLPAIDLGLGAVAVAVSAGPWSTCALLEDGRVKCWGRNWNGQLGLGDAENRGDEPGEMGDDLPAVDLGTGVIALDISVGAEHACALLQGGLVKCWGDNYQGPLGLGNEENHGVTPGDMGDSLPAVDLGAGAKAVSVAAGFQHTCALLDDGRVKCWGRSLSGVLGLGSKESWGDEPNEMGDALPAVNLGTGVIALGISTGTETACALLDAGKIKCWGSNFPGSLGLGDTKNRGDDPGEMGDNLPFLDLGNGALPVSVSAGGNHICAGIEGGKVKCWGSSQSGQLGLGDSQTRGDDPGEMGDNLPPADLGPGAGVATLSTGDGHTCGLLEEGRVKCWGANSWGILGLGDTENRGDGPGEMGDALPAVKLFSDTW